MAKFRNKPVVIEATQWFPGVIIDGVTFEFSVAAGHDMPTVKTLEGLMGVSPGDWIITGVKGERYPCKPDIFAATYVPVTDAEIDQSCGNRWSNEQIQALAPTGRMVVGANELLRRLYDFAPSSDVTMLAAEVLGAIQYYLDHPKER